VTSPFQSSASRLRSNGYSVIPLRANQKFPIIREWSQYCSESAADDTFDLWLGWPDCNIGLCLGQASGLTALDFDDDVDGLHEQIIRIVGDSPVKKAGKRGYTAFYRFGNERSASYRIGGVTVLDVLAGGRQTVLPPSIHPDGMAYRWLTPKTLENTLVSDLPVLRAEDMAKAMKLFRTEAPVTKPAYRTEPFDFGDDREISEALRYIPPDVSYPVWRDIGMAIKDKCGEKGFQVWDAWSSRGSKYAGPVKTRKIWDSFRGHGVHIGTLFHHAFQHGYVSPPPPAEMVFGRGGNLEQGDLTQKKTGPTASVPEDAGAPDDIFYNKLPREVIDAALDAPGLPGQIASFINQTAIYKQPVLSLGAGLALAGTLMANKVESPTGLRTNIYGLGIAESGTGKEWIRSVCSYLLFTAGMEKLEIGDPKSGSGLITGIVNAGGCGIAFIDEFGLYVQAITGKNVGSHQKEIARYMMQLYTSAGKVFMGAEYANKDGSTPRQSIVNPCFSMFNTTTEGNFYGSITGKEVIDGFLARFLIFESDRFPIRPQKNRRALHDVPDELHQQIQFWKQHPVNSDPGSNMGDLYNKPKTIPFTPKAQALIDEYNVRMRMKAGTTDTRQSNLSSIYCRITENAIKLALVAHENGQVDEKVAAWAIRVAEMCSGQLANAVRETIGDNEHERLFKRLLKVIGETEGAHELGVPHSALLRKTRFMDTRTRNEMLQEAVASGDIEAQPDPNREEGKTGSVPLYYRLRKK
jgi:hypothetical protein